ncbi:MAG: hypothetical protein UW09_C0001G0117 [candidate division TM6 bacterium GW2011_GWF2_43_87]|nr:MAG: hypothetical protein UW09_C0001G0117 [candidate division TM6 bacterium GW2011_GWF2_43_87]
MIIRMPFSIFAVQCCLGFWCDSDVVMKVLEGFFGRKSKHFVLIIGFFEV